MPKKPEIGPLVDRHGRVTRDLRVSLTDKCNLRCAYCMPPEGVDPIPSPELLTNDELIRLVRIAVTKLGITQVRLTGGEPLLRLGLTEIVGAISSLPQAPKLSMTTNGIGLARVAQVLVAQGLSRVNVSLDTLDRQRFITLAKRDRLDDVLAGLAAAAAAGLAPVKINTVLLRGVNDHEAPSLLEFALTQGYELRFIEQMPLDPMHTWSRESMVTAHEILASLQEAWNLTPDPAERGAAPAQTWLVDGGPAKVGIVASISKPFCGDCDRARLTADGQMRTCLFARTESDLRALIRGGANDDAIARAWTIAALGKAAGHGVNNPLFLQPARPMSAIGG